MRLRNRNCRPKQRPITRNARLKIIFATKAMLPEIWSFQFRTEVTPDHNTQTSFGIQRLVIDRLQRSGYALPSVARREFSHSSPVPNLL
jgi:hypothetical protein